MLRKLLTLLFTFVLAVSMPLVAQENAEKAYQEKVAKQGRWEGLVTRNNTNSPTLAIRQRASNFEQIIHYDSSTQWTSQEHGSSKVNNIDASQVKEGDRTLDLTMRRPNFTRRSPLSGFPNDLSANQLK